MGDKFKVSIVIWLIILSIISIAALCRTFYRSIELGIDYFGIIVGILAALCTVLIGWQIYNIIDFRRARQELEARENRLIDEFSKRLEDVQNKLDEDRKSARLNTAFEGHLLLMIIGKKREKIVLEAFRRINQIDESTDLIRGMSYQALKGTLPRLLQSQKDFYLLLKEFQPEHFDCVCKMALDEYSLTQSESDYRILELVKGLKAQCCP